MVLYPWGKGPIMGKCMCGGDVYLIYADRIYRVGYCMKCGLDSKGAKPREVDDHHALRKIVDEAYTEVSKHRTRVPVGAFFQVVNTLCVRRLKGHCPTMKVSELERWGYHIEGDEITYRK